MGFTHSVEGFMISFVLPVLIDLLREQGISKTQLLENTGLEGLDLSKAQFFNAAEGDEVCGKAIALSGDRLLGIKLGTRLDMVSLGILGYALMTSATVDDVLKLLVRYKRALLPSMRIPQRRASSSSGLGAVLQRCALYRSGD
jgi:hypothetical protein